MCIQNIKEILGANAKDDPQSNLIMDKIFYCTFHLRRYANG